MHLLSGVERRCVISVDNTGPDYISQSNEIYKENSLVATAIREPRRRTGWK